MQPGDPWRTKHRQCRNFSRALSTDNNWIKEKRSLSVCRGVFYFNSSLWVLDFSPLKIVLSLMMHANKPVSRLLSFCVHSGHSWYPAQNPSVQAEALSSQLLWMLAANDSQLLCSPRNHLLLRTATSPSPSPPGHSPPLTTRLPKGNLKPCPSGTVAWLNFPMSALLPLLPSPSKCESSSRNSQNKTFKPTQCWCILYNMQCHEYLS